MADFRLGGWVGMLVAASMAAAQDGMAVVPAKFVSAAGEVITLTLRNLTTPAAPIAWDDGRIAWSLVRIAGTQENSDRSPRADENAAPGTVRFAKSGAGVVGVDFKPRTVELAPPVMRKLIEESGRKPGTPALKVPDAATQVRLIESAKTIIRVGESGPGQSGNVTSKTGQQVELRPTFDPTGIGIGSDIPIVVYAGDGKMPGAKLVATHIGTGERQELVANDGAIGSFRLSRPGAWRVEFKHLVAATVPKEGEPVWVLYTATLTFEAREAKEGVK